MRNKDVLKKLKNLPDNTKEYVDKIHDYHKVIDNASEFEIANGVISSISTYSQNKTNGDTYNMKYVNSSKIIDVPNTYGIPILITISDGSKYMHYKTILNGLEGSPYCYLDNIQISFYNNKKIQIKIYNKKNFDSSFNLVESSGCCFSINYGGSTTDEQYKYLDSLNISVLLVNYNYLTLDNIVEYIPTKDYHPATKKYVDDATNALVKKDTNKYILITNDDTLVIKKASITDIADATIAIDNLTGKFGKLVANNDGTYSYTLNNIMTDVETFTFKVNNAEQKLVIVPYKEMKYDDKNAGITYDSNWTIEENTLYNDGSAHISVKENLATVNFNFKGCGIDIYGKTSSITGRVRAELYKGDTRLHRQIIDTNGGTSDQYDVPIFSFSNLDYDSYTIKISSYADNISIFDYIKIYNSLSNIDNSIIELYENKSSSQRSVLYIDRKNFLYTPYHMYDPTTKKYVDDLVKKSAAMCTDEEVDNMLNEVLGGDYSGN